MTATLVMPEAIAIQLHRMSCEHLETAAVLLASIVHSDGDELRLIARELIPVNDSAYVRRERDGLSIASHGYVHALGRAEHLGTVALWLHTHPGMDASPMPSGHDEIVDKEISDLFRLRSGSDLYGALIISPRDDIFAFSGHLDFESGQVTRIDRLWIVGDRLRLVRSFDSQSSGLSAIFDRNVRAFGQAVQGTLADLRIAIVGCGGTGSAIVEQLVRLGVRKVTLIDPDALSASNVTRVYGSGADDLGRYKVDVAAKHLLRIAPEAQVAAVRGLITSLPVARRLAGCDVIFGCTDDNAGRLVLSRAATYLLAPVIDCGVLITSGEGGRLVGIDGRITVLVPGQACLVCRGRVDISRAAAELLTPEERVRRADEGYAPALGQVEPAVVTFTTAVAAAAVSELLERLIGYGPEPRPSEILLRCHEREISTNTQLPRDRHYCDPAAGKIGLGQTEPFLEQAWPA